MLERLWAQRINAHVYGSSQTAAPPGLPTCPCPGRDPSDGPSSFHHSDHVMHSTDFTCCPVMYCLLSPMRLPLSTSSHLALPTTAIASPCECTPLLPPMSWVTDKILLCFTRAVSHRGPTNLAGHTRVWAVRHFHGSAFTCWPGDHCDKLLLVHVLVEPYNHTSLLTIGILLGQVRHLHPDLIPWNLCLELKRPTRPRC